VSSADAGGFGRLAIADAHTWPHRFMSEKNEIISCQRAHLIATFAVSFSSFWPLHTPDRTASGVGVTTREACSTTHERNMFLRLSYRDDLLTETTFLLIVSRSEAMSANRVGYP